MLRMDVSTNFRTNYFQSAFGGYVLGLGTTIVVMNVFNAAQPALLYIVPAILSCVFLHAVVNGETKKVRCCCCGVNVFRQNGCVLVFAFRDCWAACALHLTNQWS